ncbi:MAG TPA: OmpA family protein [Bosea sp. (in: a-proteobacteria)]|jgi:outer membrane protein OmpA-like peptidoglycan-associated protein|uniref:OmpA family protein n=1 Tax=Bosea sp. (in: a-proteobacteria) TaxID=1871050 RepID=UPI002E0EDDE5|nr:OmpA family protein [Bosea sp. (in: a-proteobacteria)]
MKTALLLLALALSGLAPDAVAAQDQPRANAAVGAGQAIDARRTETQIFRVTDANQLCKDLDARGRTNVYGILFETDTADIKPESQSQLAAIADLMTQNPDLRLDVVGHTDNQDGASDNLKLSDMRAFSVVAELSLRYRIDRARLNPFGQGLGRPVASNTDEAGRALNRRVELVRR